MNERTDSLGHLLHDASRAIRRRFEQRSAAYGLSATQWRLLVVIFRAGPLTQRALAERMDVEPISISRLIDRMEDGGWVERIIHPGDRRARLVRLSARALEVAGSLRATAQEVYDEALARFSPDERGALLHALRTIIETMVAAEPAGAAAPRPDTASRTREPTPES